jgi:hypothetical protein
MAWTLHRKPDRNHGNFKTLRAATTYPGGQPTIEPAAGSVELRIRRRIVLAKPVIHLGSLRCPFQSKELLQMNSISNIWNHPKTSITGLLIAAVTVAGVLSQQGINLGHAGSGTVITLVSAIATALLGLLAKDPGSASTVTNSTAKLGAWALIALLLPLPLSTGCSGITVAQDIVNWTPALQSAVATVDSTAALLAPVDAPIFTAATIGFDAASNLLVTQAKAYLANPTASILAEIQTQIVTFQQQVNASLLQTAKIADPASQKHALSAIQEVGTVISAMLALVESISSKSAVAQMAARSTIKLAATEPFLDKSQAAQIVAVHYSEPLRLARMQVTEAMQYQREAGF